MAAAWERHAAVCFRSAAGNGRRLAPADQHGDYRGRDCAGVVNSADRDYHEKDYKAAAAAEEAAAAAEAVEGKEKCDNKPGLLSHSAGEEAAR